MGTESDNRSWKKDDIVGTSQLVMSCIINYKQGHLKVLFLMYCSAPLFLKKTEVAFFWYESVLPKEQELIPEY